MRVLAFDPSSSAIGFAEIDGDDVVWAGSIARPDGWHSWFRLRSMAPSVAEVVAAARFERVVVEVPGRAQAGRRRAEFATPGVYAAAVGVVLGVLWRVLPESVPVVTVESDHWTRRGGSGWGVRKSRRVLAIADLPGYDAAGDRGGDEADAIMLARWYERRARLCSRVDLHFPAAGASGALSMDTVDWERVPRPIGARFDTALPPRVERPRR